MKRHEPAMKLTIVYHMCAYCTGMTSSFTTRRAMATWCVCRARHILQLCSHFPFFSTPPCRWMMCFLRSMCFPIFKIIEVHAGSFEISEDKRRKPRTIFALRTKF